MGTAVRDWTKGDYRPIDDYSEFGHNSLSSREDTVDTAGVDAIVSLAKYWWDVLLNASQNNWHFTARLSDGTSVQGIVAEDFRGLSQRALCARLLDLAKAYKLLPCMPSLAWLAIVAIYSPTKKTVRAFLLRLRSS